MRQIIVYYSLEGNSDYIARKMQKETGADLLRLETVKPFPNKGPKKYIVGGRSALFGHCPKLKEYSFRKEEYDVIILGCPVWAGTMASPMKTFLKNESLSDKKVKLYMCHSDKRDTKSMEKFKKALAGNQILDTLLLVDPLKKEGSIDSKRLTRFEQAE